MHRLRNSTAGHQKFRLVVANKYKMSSITRLDRWSSFMSTLSSLLLRSVQYRKTM